MGVVVVSEHRTISLLGSILSVCVLATACVGGEIGGTSEGPRLGSEANDPGVGSDSSGPVDGEESAGRCVE